MFSSRSFMVSDLTFNILIHFELIFVYGVRVLSNLTYRFFRELLSRASSFETVLSNRHRELCFRFEGPSQKQSHYPS